MAKRAPIEAPPPLEILFERMNSGAWTAAREAELELVEAVLDRLASSRLLNHRFLCAAVGRPVTREHLNEAIDALGHLNHPAATARRQRSERWREVAKNPRLVEVIQGLAGLGQWLPEEWLSVLILDASEASLDALIPQVALAQQSGDERLDMLHALLADANESLETLRALVNQHRADRSERLFGRLAKQFGIDARERIAFSFSLQSTRHQEGVLLAELTADSMTASPLAVQISLVEGNKQPRVVPVGRIAPDDLPARMAEIARAHQVSWIRELLNLKTRTSGLSASGLLGWLLPTSSARPGP